MSVKRILVMGLPGAGKTTFATALVARLGNAAHLNADAIRELYNDWDFSDEGRVRQANRMKALSEEAVAEGKWAVADFVCPTARTRNDFNPDFVVWVDTIKEGRFEDTNRIFEAPENYDVRVDSYDTDAWLDMVEKKLKEKEDHGN